MIGYGDGEGEGSGSGSGSESCSSFPWDPITVDLVVSSVSQLRDAAMAAYGAAGDTVIIDGVTAVEGTVGRGIWRIVGFAGFLTQMDGSVRDNRSYAELIPEYTYPDDRTVSQRLSGVYVNGSWRVAPITNIVNPSVYLDAGPGVCTSVDPVTLSASVTGLNRDMGPPFGTVTFYINEYTRTEDVCASQDGPEAPWVFGVAISVTSTTFGGTYGSYQAIAVYNSTVSGNTKYSNGESNSVTIGVN